MNTALSINEAIARLKINSKITNFSNGSISRAFIETYANIAAQESDKTEQEIVDLMISYASGEALDNIGTVFGISRKGASYSQGSVSVNINSSYNLSLADLIAIVNEKTGKNYTELIIPAGTIFSNEDKTINYTSLSDLTLTSNTNTVSVLSSKAGIAQSVIANSLTTIIDPPEQLQFIASYLTISNDESISNGENSESDNNFRYRIINFYISNANANNTALRLAALSVSGVSDVRINNFRYGLGTTDVMVISQDPLTSDGLLAAVKQALVNVEASSEEVYVSAPGYIGITYRVRVEFKISTLSNTEKDAIVTDIQENIVDHINSLQVGTSLIFSDIIRIITENTNIKTYYIDKAARGTYNKTTGLIDYAEPILLVDQSIGNYYKFVANFKTITTCY